jgi:predicted nucleotidyltransferase
MRLSDRELAIIKETLSSIFDHPQIYLFGSRTDSQKRGGDIDLFVIAENAGLEQKLKALARLEQRLGKPVDLLLHRDFSRPIEQEALKGIRL